jgi:hypothetical protein
MSDNKKPYFIMSSIRLDIPDKPELFAKMNTNNYSEPIIKNGNLIEFINMEFVEKGKQIDLLVLAGCNYFYLVYILLI